jgi:chloramphenicol-sensitive protein RarD
MADTQHGNAMEKLTAERKGLLYGILAYIIWGTTPIYFKLLQQVPAAEVLSHRVFWSSILLLLIIAITRRWDNVRKILYEPKKILMLTATSFLIGLNWIVYIWAIATDQILEASMGYFIMPLMMVLLGVIFLKEKLNTWQWLAVGLTTIGVLIQIVDAGKLPWIALTEAITFSVYGLIRKRINVDALTGLLLETLILYPFALYILFGIPSHTGELVDNSLSLNIILIAAGIVTTIPLLFFAGASTRIKLTTLGLLQYISPTFMWILAVYVYHEPFVHSTLITFAFIWAGLVCFSLQGYLSGRK